MKFKFKMKHTDLKKKLLCLIQYMQKITFVNTKV